MEMFEVIVVGAGPAGSSAARDASLAGLSTLLLEKQKLPREKRCGGGISAAALKELDFTLPDRIVERRCYGMWGIQNSILTEVRVDRCVATMVSRSTFDAFLVEKAVEAGARIAEAEACREIRVLPDCVIVLTEKAEYRAALVIGADGVSSLVARSVRPKWKRREMRFCLVADVPLSPESIYQKMRDLVELRYGFIRRGYAWAFPKRDHVSFGIGGTVGDARALRLDFARYLKLHGIDSEVPCKGCFIPVSEFRHDVVADRLMLCGDAAGFVDCFNGEGIRYAIASGRLAGRAAALAFKKGDFSKRTLFAYQRAFYARHKKDLVWSSFIMGLSSRLPRLVFGPLLADRKTILRYFKVMSGDEHFRSFARWIIVRLPWLIVRHFLVPGSSIGHVNTRPKR
ncbi:MAG: geranylgeranyl reductase family protein [Spirochaetia bacterium]|jgi:geranylgeranyl reductase family protein